MAKIQSLRIGKMEVKLDKPISLKALLRKAGMGDLDDQQIKVGDIRVPEEDVDDYMVNDDDEVRLDHRPKAG